MWKSHEVRQGTDVGKGPRWIAWIMVQDAHRDATRAYAVEKEVVDAWEWTRDEHDREQIVTDL